MDIYNVLFDADKDLGVYGISVVSEPAMESQFIALSKQKIKLAEVDKKEYLLAGVTLIPDKDVYRNQDGKEFYLRFSADTIKDISHSFIKNGYQNNSSVEHEGQLQGVSVVESWVVRDPKNDTANAYGLPKEDIKKGSWVVLYKCDNKEVYESALRGEITGFSIDGLFNLEKVNLKKSKMIEEISKFKDQVIAEVKTILNKQEQVSINLGKAMLKDGSAEIEFVGETMESGADIFIVNGEEKAPLPIGEYLLEDETVVIVSEDGKIDSVKAKEEEVIEEVKEEMSGEDIEALKNEIKDILVNYALETKSTIDDLKASFDLKLSKQKEIIEELKKTPVATPINSAPTQLSKPRNATERLLNVINKNKK